MTLRHLTARRDVIVLAAYFFLALALTYPLFLHLTTHVSGQGVDDPAQTWSLWWLKYSIFNLGISPLSTDYIFYPLGINLVAYTPTFLNGLLSVPLQFATSVILAQNAILYFSLVAGGYGTFLLAREILARHNIHSDLAAALAGAFYAFGAWHINYADATYMLLSNEWLPFYALYLIRFDRQPWRNGARAGLFLLLAMWTELTYMPLLALFTALYLLYHALTQRGAWRQILSNLIPLGVLAVIGIAPLALSLLNDTLRYGYYLAQGLGRVQIFSAEPISFFVPSAQHPLLGTLASRLTTANTRYAFVGYAALAFALIGFTAQRAAQTARFWAITAIFFALIMLGPTLIVGGQSTGIPMPYAALTVIPFVNANRYPVRFNVMMMLALTPLIAFGAARLLQTPRGTLRVALGGLTVLLAFEQLVIPIPLSDLRVPAIYQTIGSQPGDFSILELPLGWRGSISLQGKMQDQAEFYQTVHHKRLLGGITSRTPRFKTQYFLELPVINSLIALETGRTVDDARLAQDRAAATDVLRFFNIRYVDIDRALAGPQVGQYARDTFPLTEYYRDDTRTIYRVDPPPPLTTINPADETARLYFDDSWGRAQSDANGTGYRWAMRGDSLIWLPLPQQTQTITFRLRGVSAGQPVRVNVNGNPVADLKLTTDWNDYSVAVPASVLRDSLNDFVFAADTVPVSATRQDSYTIGDTGVVAPVDIAATGAGYDAGRFGEIFVAGKNVIDSQRGYHLVAVNPQSGAVDRVGSFDTLADANASTRLAQFIASLPRGEIVAGVAVDDVSGKLQQSAVDALRSIGVAGDLRYQFRVGQAFIGVTGAQPGQALEREDGRFPVNVAVGKDVASDRVAFALGGIRINR